MAHDATKVILGGTKSSYKTVTNHAGTVLAGLGVRLKSDNTLSVAKADGELKGVSLGTDLSNIGRTSIVREGAEVPVVVGAGVTIGKQAAVHDTTGVFYDQGTGSTTAVNAHFTSARLVAGGLREDGLTTVDIAFLDMTGGL